MKALHSTLLRTLFGIILTVVGLYSDGALAQPHPKDAVAVHIAVQDEAGQPIPYVTVWGFIDIDPQIPHYAIFHVGADDLWRMTQRYGPLHEIISDHLAGKPLAELGIFGMGDAAGEVMEAMDFLEIVGHRKNYFRPDPWHFGFSLLKRGYFPGKVEFSVAKNQTSAEATVVLKRNPAEAINSAPYMQSFERVRYQMSRFQFVGPLNESQATTRSFATQLGAAAQQAVAAGDRATAARIYARMRLLPKIVHETNGSSESSGLVISDVNSAESMRAMDMAFQLDPHNLYVWMSTMDRQITVARDAPQEERARGLRDQLDKIIAQYGESAWPTVYDLRALMCVVLGDYARAHDLYLQAAQLEPKYTDWDKKLAALKAEMARKKVPIPEGW